ncbi:amidase [Ahniella affigens]|uniref:Amidase n=1 Tax=Ahniella affigens TaxID=2021234 RepID=A0A2P1PSF6_9GAMM|nr:amidase family protein [Ahniella affigens]AVP97771.1 amidase [Ahniella affigens]
MSDREQVLSGSACRMLAMLDQRDISASELANWHIERIEATHPALNAVVCKRFDAARAEAQRADQQRRDGAPLGPLHGLPITLKECLQLAGTPDTFGLPWRASLLAETDDAYVQQLRQDGAIVLGKTNVAQSLLYYETDNPVYGRSNHPKRADRSCGGSSGGEAAIIAVGGSALGFGTDIGGSSRIPAAFCGILGFKPTEGRAPDFGAYSLPLGQRAIPSQMGVLARHVEDLTLGLTCLSKVHCQATPPLKDLHQVEVSRLRIGFYVDDGTLTPAPGIQRVVREAADRLSAAGASVFAWQPPKVPEALGLYFALLSADGGRGFRELLRDGPVDPRLRDLSRLAGLNRPVRALARLVLRGLGQPTLATFVGHFGRRSVDEYWQLQEAQRRYRAEFAEAMRAQRIDLVLGPPCALPAYRHGDARDVGLGGGYALLWNLLGYPAGTIGVSEVRADEESDRPDTTDWVVRAAKQIERGSTGLPLAVQLAAPPWQDHLVLAAMRELEKGRVS